MFYQYHEVKPEGALALIPEDSVAAQYGTAAFSLEPNTGLLMVQGYYVYAKPIDNELYLISASHVDDGTDLVRCASPVLTGHGRSQFRVRQVTDYITVRLDRPDSPMAIGPGDPTATIDLIPLVIR